MPTPRPSRRTFFVLPVLAAAWPAFAKRPLVITVLGDSITAGYGLPGKAALPNQLHLALAHEVSAFYTFDVRLVRRAKGGKLRVEAVPR